MSNNKRAAGTAAVVLLFLIVFLFPSCLGNSSSSIHTEYYYSYFDTVSQLSSYAFDKEETFKENAAEVGKVLEHWHMLLDIYHEYEGMNNLCTVNSHAGEAVTVDADLIGFMQYAREMCEKTNGETDMSLGAVLRLWHEASEAEVPYVPEEEALKEAYEHTGFDLVEIDAVNNTIRLTDPLASLDPGALGKGFAAEKAAQMLKARGVKGYAVNLGGNIRLVGKRAEETPWITGIRDPMNTEEVAVQLTLSDTSCVTSGDYERYFTVGGVQYNHIIDKDTLKPAAYFSSVSVITEDSGLADALATALFCMSFEDGLALVSAMDGVEAIWIAKDASIYFTMGIQSSMSVE